MNSDVINNVQGYEFSENQKNLWLLGRENQSLFFNRLLLKFQNKVSSENIQNAIEAVIQKHQVLSLKLRYDKNFSYPLQFFSEDLGNYYHEIEGLKDDNVISILEKQLEYDYDSSKDSPIRFSALNVNGDIKFLCIKLYSLWGDAYSNVFFSNELSRALEDIENYKKEEVEKVDYLNFCAWQTELINEPEAEALQFWKKYDSQLNQKVLPFAKTLGSQFNPKKEIICCIEGERFENLKKYCIENTFEISDVLLFEFSKYLSLFSENEITIGYVPFERNYEELDNTLGLVTKNLPFKFKRVDNTPKSKIINESKNQIEKLKNWSDYFTLNREERTDKLPIFNYCFEFIDFKKNEFIDSFHVIDNYSIQDAFELKICCTQFVDRIIIEIYYDQGVFHEKDFNVIKAQLENCFSNINVEKDDILGELSQYENNIISTSNNTKKELPQFLTVLDLFEEQVKKNPNKVATIFENRELTYNELNVKANQLANCLITNYNVIKGDAVCILLERSDWFIISMLGVLKVGAYYVPIDIDYPEERIQFILNDCSCKVLICLEEITGSKNYSREVLDPCDTKIYANNISLQYDLEVLPHDIAYCIYTSGSTGIPKGCLITNKNLSNYVQWANDFYFDYSTEGNWGLITSVSFDLTVTSIYTSLTRGMKLWIGSNQIDIYELLKESFNNEEIDTLKLTPTHLSILKEINIEKTYIKKVICGGEQLTINQIKNLKNINENINIYNEYGPTETTVGCVVKEIENDDTNVVIGKPIANTKIYIFDENGSQCSIGVTGEIGIMGHGLAKGYLNREELSQEKFIENFSSTKERLYRTGDIGRWLPDGNIEYLGRKDNQVKIRGYRIELNEIESILNSYEYINETVVLAIEDNEDNKKLTAFFTSENQLSYIDLRNYLADKIPSYMIPEDFIPVEKFQLTINGKIDKQYLINLKNKAIEFNVEYVAPTNLIEEKLAKIWEGILNKEKIGINDNFFLLGGNSLLVMKLINRISFEFGIKIHYKTFFDKPNISSLALEILFLIEQNSVNEEDNLIELDI